MILLTPRVAAALALLLAAALWIPTLFFSGYLRPIADDYCFAARYAEFGFGSYLWWMSNWSGDFFSYVGLVGAVGWPLVTLTPELGSSIAFVLSALSVGIVVAAAVSFVAQTNARTFLSIALVTAATWPASHWVAARTSGEELDLQLASAITHWQTINLMYVVAPALLVMMVVSWLKSDPAKLDVRAPIFLPIIGFAAGTGGLLFGAYVVVIGLLASIAYRVRGNLGRSRSFLWGASATLLGMIVTQVTPGSGIRRTALGEPRWVFGTIDWLRTSPSLLVDWAGAVLSLQSVVALLCGVALAHFVRASEQAVDSRRALNVGSSLVASAVVLYVVNGLLENLVYGGFWHVVSARLVIFVGVVLLGISGASAFDRLKLSKLIVLKFMAPAMSLAFVLVLSAGSLNMWAEMINRSAAWEVGAAPASGIDDRDAGWVADCHAAWEMVGGGGGVLELAPPARGAKDCLCRSGWFPKVR